MARSEGGSRVLEIGTPGVTRRGLGTGPWRTYTGTELETADTAKGSLPIPRQSSTLPIGRGLETGAWRTAPALDPTAGQDAARVPLAQHEDMVQTLVPF